MIQRERCYHYTKRHSSLQTSVDWLKGSFEESFNKVRSKAERSSYWYQNTHAWGNLQCLCPSLKRGFSSWLSAGSKKQPSHLTEAKALRLRARLNLPAAFFFLFYSQIKWLIYFSALFNTVKLHEKERSTTWSGGKIGRKSGGKIQTRSRSQSLSFR